MTVCLMVVASACGEHDGEGLERVSIAHLRTLYRGYPITISEDIYIEGRVVSDDRYGNFYHTLVLQDSTGGIPIRIYHNALHTLHPLGSTLRVRCLGLQLGSYGGAVRLGGESDGRGEVSDLSPADWARSYVELGEVANVEPRRVAIAELSARDIATLVMVEGVAVVEGGRLWSEVAEEREVHVVDGALDTLVVSLSPYEELFDSRVPTGRVDVVGVLDYFRPHYQLVISSVKSLSPR